jgi:hypothetical protein
MKATTLEAPDVLLDITREMKRGYAVLVRRGRPVAYLFSAANYDGEDIGYMTNPKFWDMIRLRRKGSDLIPLEQIEAEIAGREQAEKRQRRTMKNGKRK